MFPSSTARSGRRIRVKKSSYWANSVTTTKSFAQITSSSPIAIYLSRFPTERRSWSPFTTPLWISLPNGDSCWCARTCFSQSYCFLRTRNSPMPRAYPTCPRTSTASISTRAAAPTTSLGVSFTTSSPMEATRSFSIREPSKSRTPQARPSVDGKSSKMHSVKTFPRSKPIGVHI